MGFSLPRALISLALALSLVPFASSAVLAGEAPVTTTVAAPAAPPAADPGVVAQASADNGAFQDVPLDHWAYQAVAELAADGYIKGYPDGTFKGNRPMTRYEIAVLTERAVSAIKSAIVQGQQVNATDIAALKKLAAAFPTDIKNVQGQLAAEKQQAAALQQSTSTLATNNTAIKNELDASAVSFRQNQLGIQIDARYGTTWQDVEVTNGAYARAAAGATSPAVLANAPFPAGYGAVPGVTRGTGFSFGPGGPSSNPVGYAGQGVYDYEFKPWLVGVLPGGRFGYFFRLALTEQVAPGGLTTSTPIYCTAQGLPASYPCVYQDSKSNWAQVPITLDSFYASWNSGHGMRALVGKFTAATSTQDFSPLILAGNKMTGVLVGYKSPTPNSVDGYYAVGNPNVSAETFAAANAGSAVCTAGVLGLNAGPVLVTNLGINPYCNSSSTNQYFHLGYHLNSTRTTVGYNSDVETNISYTYWNPAAGLCATSAANQAAGVAAAIAVSRAFCSGATPFPLVNASGAFINAQGNITQGDWFLVQEFGSRAPRSPRAAVQFDYTTRYGNDPFTGSAWVGSHAYQFAAVFASKGNIDEGGVRGAPTSLSSGKKDSNVAELIYNNVGMNSIAPSSGPYIAQTAPFYNAGVSNFSGMSMYAFLLDHWFQDYFRIGVTLMHYGNSPGGVVIPAGSSTCPGCFVPRVNANTIYINAFTNSVGGD
jgi:hypothetical protein